MTCACRGVYLVFTCDQPTARGSLMCAHCSAMDCEGRGRAKEIEMLRWVADHVSVRSVAERFRQEADALEAGDPLVVEYEPYRQAGVAIFGELAADTALADPTTRLVGEDG